MFYFMFDVLLEYVLFGKQFDVFYNRTKKKGETKINKI